ncbi:MAG: glycosyltransferase [Cytophagales bacterium]|nr:glycosyltransferase [Cytophagales bacterium]
MTSSFQKNIKSLSRWTQPFPYKTACLISIIYGITLRGSSSFSVFFLPFIGAFTMIAGFFLLGYLIHDSFDKEEDERAGKARLWHCLARSLRIKFWVLAATLILPAGFLLPLSRTTIGLGGAEILAFILYAVPPFRAKKNIWLSVLLDAAYAHIIPSLLIAHIFLSLEKITVPISWWITLIAWQSCLGIRHYLQHLCTDIQSDKRAKRNTLATHLGTQRIRQSIQGYLLPTEIFCASLFWILFLGLWKPLAIGIMLAWISFRIIESMGKAKTYTLQDHIIDSIYLKDIPLLLCIPLFFIDPLFLSLLIPHLFLYFPKYIWQLPISYPIKKFASLSINYSIYYSRRYLLLRSEKESRKVHYPTYLDKKKRQEKGEKQGNIALFNIEEEKYTETYIHALRKKLPFGVHYFYGKNFPAYEYQKGHLISENEGFRKAYECWEMWRGKEGVYLKLALARSLIKYRVRCLLAQFGTVGTQLLEVQAQTGIPLVVYYHGYDAYQKSLLIKYQHLYKNLFQKAHSLICVSQDMKAQLIHLGAAPDKIHYLPAYVNLDLFTYSNHSEKTNKNFLFIGRFCNTKAPYLLLMSFAKVVKNHPETTLSMVGMDERGELWEACQIITKALKLESHVEFKGILSPIQIKEEMKKAYALVLPSLSTPIEGEKEGTPVVIMEAAASGLPVIATRHAGIHEILKDSQTALLVDEYDINGLSQAMIHLLSSPSLAYELGLRASQSIRNHPLLFGNIKELTLILKEAMHIAIPS